ncbi:MAG: radical SAM protein [Acidobacteria bacterium]|nr:radical SAM protein [Acidobacteriota bacterium]
MTRSTASAQPQARPARVDIKLGFSCNNHCQFCVQGPAKRAEYGDKDTAELRTILKEARQHCDQVVLTGGEVTIRRDLPELVAYAHQLGFSVIQLQTNGRVLSNQRALDRLITAGVTEISPAIHGPDSATHDALTGSRGSFKQTVKGVQNARAMGIPVLINSVITRANHRLLPRMAALFVALKVNQFQMAFVHPLGAAADNFDDVVPRLSATAPYVHKALAIANLAGLRAMTEGIPLCFLPGLEHHAAEWIIPDTRIVDAAWTIDDYTALRRSQGKAKGPPCAACRHNEACEGPWKEYPERFGWDEFVAVS